MSEFDSVVLEPTSEGQGITRYFTPEEANRSLVLISRIAKDILGLYCQAKILEERYSVLDPESEREARRQIKLQHEKLLKKLQGYNQELNMVGCRLRDWQTGAIDWPAVCEGRDVYLCWRLGEEAVEYYHEAFESFAARKRLQDGFHFSTEPAAKQKA